MWPEVLYFFPQPKKKKKSLLITDINQNSIMGTDNKVPKDKMGWNDKLNVFH